DDRLRGATRRKYPGPKREVVILDPCHLGNRRYVGSCRRTFGGRKRENLQGAALHVWRGSRKSRKVKIDVIADQGIQRRACPFIRDMGKVLVKLHLEELACEMTRSANAGGGKSHLRLGFQCRKKFLQSRIRRLGGHYERQRHHGRERDRHKVLVRIVVEALEPMLVDCNFAGLPHAQG